MPHNLSSLVPQLANHRIIVVGDVILDEYLYGNATRMSREAPIPVLEFESRRLIPGGAANPSTNIVALGSQALQVGLIGDDDAGKNLREVLTARDVDIEGLFSDPTRPTTLKTRLMAQMGLRFPQQVARMDTLSRQPINTETAQRIQHWITQRLDSVDAVLFSDYHGGIITSDMVDSVRQYTNGTILTADAQGSLEKYTGFTLVKCNADDAKTYLGRDLVTDDDFARAACDLFAQLSLNGGMVITRGSNGATLSQSTNDAIHCPAPKVSDVYDTVGAGDTAIAVMTLALVADATYHDAVMLANTASGLVVRRFGNYTPTATELSRALDTAN